MRSVNVALPENSSNVFSLALQDLNNIMEHNFAAATKAEALDRPCVVEDSVAASLPGGTVEKIDLARKTQRVVRWCELFQHPLDGAPQIWLWTSHCVIKVC